MKCFALYSAGQEPSSKKPKIELNLGINLNANNLGNNSNNSMNSTLTVVGGSGSRGGVDSTPLAQIEGINEEAVRRLDIACS